MAGFLIASRIAPTYEAQVQLLVGPINTDSDTLKASGLLVQTYGQLAISAPLLKSTAQEAGGIDPARLAQSVRSSANDATRVLAIRVQDADPARAASIANLMADELIQLTTGATTRPEGQLEVIGAAVPPTTPIAPQVPLIILLAMIAGFLASLVLVILVEYVTDSVRDDNDVARLTGSDVLATLGFRARTPGADPMPVPEAAAPTSAIASAFRILASKVAFAEAGLTTRTIAIVGLGEGDSGLVTTALGAAVAGSGYRVVLVDGSTNADITTSFGFGALLGLREAVADNGKDVRSSLAPGPIGLEILPRGLKGSLELVAIDRARDLLQALLSDADLVIIDGGAMQRSGAALSWARAAQQTILVVRLGTTRREDLRTGIESLRFVKANVSGAVVMQRAPGRSFGRSLEPRLDLDSSELPNRSQPAHYGWSPDGERRPAAAQAGLNTSPMSQAGDGASPALHQFGAPVGPTEKQPATQDPLGQNANPAGAPTRRRRKVNPPRDGLNAPPEPGGTVAWPRPNDDASTGTISPRTRRAD